MSARKAGSVFAAFFVRQRCEMLRKISSTLKRQRKNEKRSEKRNEKRSGKRNRERSRKQIKKEAEKRLGEKIWIQERYWKK